MTKQFREYRAQKEFEEIFARLEVEIARRTHRRHLAALVRLLSLLVEQCGTSLAAASLRERLEEKRALIEKPLPRRRADSAVVRTIKPKHPHLRLVK